MIGRNAATCRWGSLLAFLATFAPAGAASPAADYVWWEGESPTETNFPKQSWFSPPSFRDRAHLLSEGNWLTNSGNRTGDEAFAKYAVVVPSAGEWNLWCRKFWKHGPFRWRFDSGAWQTCSRDVALADDTYLRTHVGANWVHLGKVRLAAGEHAFELRLLAKEGEGLTACFDCFCLIRGAFLPNGRLKPGEKSNQADEGFFAYEPGADAFRPDAMLDLRRLNEQTAGSAGHVRRDGDRFVLGGGKEVRFFAVNVSASNAAQSRESVDYLARRLAKLGVNMVRFHSPLFDRTGDPAKVDAKKLDDLHYLVAAMKRQGIYTKISFYFPLWFDIKPHYGIDGFDRQANKRPFALLYFEPRMQQIHRSWAKALLTTPNPYTRLPIARDPAVAIVEIINEDSYFFWTFSSKNIPAVHWQQLEKLYGDWLAKEYGPEARSRAKLLDAWHMTAGGLKQGGPEKLKRMRDQVRFLAENQRKFYEDTVSYYKKDLGYRGLVSCSNWQVADPAVLDTIERYTYTAGDVIDRHGYFGGQHTGDGASYSVRNGHAFTDRPAVLNPDKLPIQVLHIADAAGYPHIISELGWTHPNRYRSDATLLAAAYGCLQGTDGTFFFAVGSNFLADTSMAKFPVGTPVTAGTFPAAALLYRRGDVKEPDPAVRLVIGPDELYSLSGKTGSTAEALDALRKKDIPAARKASASAAIDPLAFYVGPVVRSLDPKATPVATDLSKYIDRDKKTITSSTGELRWDYGAGVVGVNTPRSQAAAGFLAKAGPLKLADVTIECANEYAAIIVTSLDDLPLSRSRRILIQAMTEDRPYGFRAPGGRIASMGSAPFGIKRIDASVTLKLAGGAKCKVTALDENGYATDKAVGVVGSLGGATIKLAGDAIYHVVTR
ncbi:MAG: hypothetical protein WBF17_12095 [Phycisphaerae bacterium]